MNQHQECEELRYETAYILYGKKVKITMPPREHRMKMTNKRPPRQHWKKVILTLMPKGKVGANASR